MLFKTGKCCERSPFAVMIALTAALVAVGVAFLLKAQEAPGAAEAAGEAPAASGDAALSLWIAGGSAVVLVLVAAATIFARWREKNEH